MSRHQPVATAAAASAARMVVKKHVFKKLQECVVDSENFSFWASRRRLALRKNEISRVNTNIIVNKCFEELADIIEKKDGYEEFFELFGKFLKLSIHENSTSQTEITELVRFSNPKSW